MTSKRWPRLISAAVILAGILVFLAWAFFHGHKERETEKEEERITQGPSRLSVIGGERAITLEPESQTKSGIVLEPLKQVSHREEVRAYGIVMELQSLVALRKNLIDLRKGLVDAQNNHAAARGQVEKTTASLVASRKQYERLKVLSEDNRNVSEKAMQAGEAAFRTDEANFLAAQEALQAAQKSVRAAEESLTVLEDAARQQWGSVLSRWLYEAPPSLERLLRQQDLLIQITLPSDIRISSPSEIARVQTPSGNMASVRLISPSPRTDPRLQGLTFFYLVSAPEAGLLPGMNVLAYLPAGKEIRGWIVPAPAVIWWQGKAWVYLQRDANQFLRREISTKAPLPEGWFAEKEFSGKEKIVVKGSQLLLSEELRAQLHEE